MQLPRTSKHNFVRPMMDKIDPKIPVFHFIYRLFLHPIRKLENKVQFHNEANFAWWIKTCCILLGRIIYTFFCRRLSWCGHKKRNTFFASFKSKKYAEVDRMSSYSCNFWNSSPRSRWMDSFTKKNGFDGLIDLYSLLNKITIGQRVCKKKHHFTLKCNTLIFWQMACHRCGNMFSYSR